MTDYKKKGKLLKTLGLVDYDLRKELTRGQKATISRYSNTANLNNKFRNIVRHADEYVRRTVKPAIFKTLKEEGYTAHKKSVFIPLNGYDSVRIGKYNKFNVIIREIKSRKKGFKRKRQIDIIAPRNQLINNIEYFSLIKLPKGTFITAKTSNQRPFSALYPSLADLAAYINNSWGGRESKDALASLSFVIIEK